MLGFMLAKTMGNMLVELCYLLRFSSLIRDSGSFVLDHLEKMSQLPIAICRGRGWQRVRPNGTWLGGGIFHRENGVVELDRWMACRA